jgi:uncharacterized membrane protein
MIAAFLRWHALGAGWWLAGGGFYLIGTIFVTIVFNVPRNDALAVPALTSSEAGKYWADYLTSWTAWNHVR